MHICTYTCIYIYNIPYPHEHGKRCKNWSIHPRVFAKKMLSELGALSMRRILLCVHPLMQTHGR